MSALVAVLADAADCLAKIKKPWALLGGFAVSARTEPRFTRDVDLAVAVQGDAEAEAVVVAFRDAGFLMTTSVEQDALGRLATARLVSRHEKHGGAMLDLLFASSGIEPEICAAAEPMEILPGVVVPVARASHLLALKILARDDRTRPQDAGDIRALLRVLDEAGIMETRRVFELITARRYQRNRDLPALLDEAIRNLALQ